MCMSTTAVSSKILSEAEEQARQILAETEKEVQQIQDQAQKELDALDKQIQADVDQAAQQEQHRILAAARQAITSELLKAKHQVLDEVFTTAKQALADMPPEQYRQFLVDLLKQALSTGNEVVLPAEGEKHLDQQLRDQANQQLKKNAALQLSQEKIPGSGGFLLSADKISTKVTWEVLLEQARRELEPELAKILFSASQAPEQSGRTLWHPFGPANFVKIGATPLP